MTPEEKLAELGLTLPPVAAPIANFVTHVEDGSLLYLSGQGPRDHNGQLATGKVGAGVSVEEAYAHAQLTGLNLLAVMKHALGDLGRVERVVKLLGMVNADPLFCDHPKVINGCSDLMVNVFGDKGRHARSAVGFGSLPGQITVEIEAIVRFRKD
ncbi:possible endoribonuclease, L-PSP family [Aurantimonas manganoxydans SI85-9A1]|uniref:Possible endoribonuclease, L-PSP family n=1 Tax=Aurantimonas manganoxydans (strain ATCC BAA-1229 / DSM 21871 / SI85-9A1) TaxID=287752 RepID=Q1YGT1_AURMS|nr:RidA family protein [Aurantimonas manganoxydans]EAS49144.1 possible endoribonuclease, L-PSP family [Aurantimonas manganoxydans SI85-9A1]